MTVVDILFCAVNVVTFFAFMLDKLYAKWDRRRIPESVLLLMGLCGGATGGYIAMRLFHHKTRKPLFFILMPLMMVAEIGLYVWL